MKLNSTMGNKKMDTINVYKNAPGEKPHNHTKVEYLYQTVPLNLKITSISGCWLKNNKSGWPGGFDISVHTNNINMLKFDKPNSVEGDETISFEWESNH